MKIAFSWAASALATLADLLASGRFTEDAKRVRQIRDEIIDMDARYRER